MAVKLHRCRNEWLKIGAHPCWSVEKALNDMGIEYTTVGGPLRRGQRDEMDSHTGQSLYPAIEFENGAWYREESKEMEKTIRDGKLMERANAATAPASG